MNKSIRASAIVRNDLVNNIQGKTSEKDQIEGLQNENNALTFLVAKYNIILEDYQTKYGNEIFYQIDNMLSDPNNPDMPNPNSGFNVNDMISVKKKLIENISLIKEYEANLTKKENEVAAINSEKNNLQKLLDDLQRENDELQKDNSELRADRDKMESAILGQNKLVKVHQTITTTNQQNIQSNTMDFKSQTTNQFNDYNNNNYTEINNEIQIKDEEINKLKLENQQLKEKLNNNQNLNSKIPPSSEELVTIKNKLEVAINGIQEKENIIKNLQDEKDSYLNEIDNLRAQLFEKTNNITDLNNNIFNLEKEKNSEALNINKLKTENKIYKKENLDYKGIYEEMEIRKNNEINTLINDNNNLKEELTNLKNKLKLKDDQISNKKYENAQLKQENTTLKSDCDHLTKILEDSNLAVQTATEKEKHIDSIIKSYKKKIEEINLEKDKLNLKIQMQQNQISKFTNEYTDLIKEKSSTYDNMMNISKSKYEDIIRNKNEEIAHLKTELLSSKIEKDKYFSEYKTMQNEFNRIQSNFHSENDNYISKYEESQKKLNSIMNDYEEKITKLTIENNKLESENRMNLNELNNYRNNEKLREKQFLTMTQNENKLTNELTKYKDKVNFYTKENEATTQDKDRLIALYETKLKNLQEECDIKIVTLENTIHFQKDQLNLVESKAYDMLKKQEKLTEKFKKEYFNTIDYYEGVIAYITGKGKDPNDNYPQITPYEENVE